MLKSLIPGKQPKKLRMMQKTPSASNQTDNRRAAVCDRYDLYVPQPIKLIIFLSSYLLVGGEVVLKAVKNITKGQVFDENFLMSVATIGAFGIGDFAEGVAVMLFIKSVNFSGSCR